jgi:hypothetical protein
MYGAKPLLWILFDYSLYDVMIDLGRSGLRKGMTHKSIETLTEKHKHWSNTEPKVWYVSNKTYSHKSDLLL